MTRCVLAAILLGAGLLSACGGATGEPRSTRPQTTAPEPSPPSAGVLALPADVPLKGSRAADPDQTKVIRGWAAALRAGDIERATALWAVPSKVQNGTPVLSLSRRTDVRAFNASLPCGSVVIAAGGAKRDFTIATVHLTKRRGADCDAPAGAVARTAIRVQGGRIVEWYRLPDDPDAPTEPLDDVDSTTV